MLTRITAAVTRARLNQTMAATVETTAEGQQRQLTAMAGRAPRIEARCEGPNGLAVIRICDAPDVCAEVAYACAPVGCRDGKCGPPSCRTDLDCAPTARCNPTTGACVAQVVGRRCESQWTSVDALGDSASCSPYQCRAGVCRGECVTTTDCIDGYECRGRKCTVIKPPCTRDAECGGEGWTCNQGRCVHTTVDVEHGWGL